MEIVLLRHGMPRVKGDRRMSAAEFAEWVVAYNRGGIDPESRPPDEAVEQARRCAFVVCSDLPRSGESATALGVQGIDACATLFREMDMPSTGWRLVRLPVAAWAVLFRLMWLFGYSARGESFKEGRRRARRCAGRLAHWASRHETVLFVGHGTLNWFIARHLKRMGWAGPAKAPRNHWEFGVYRRDQD